MRVIWGIIMALVCFYFVFTYIFSPTWSKINASLGFFINP